MKHIEETDQAIDFKAEDYLGQPINLSNFKGQKIMLSFFRGASCPFCNLRLHQLINKHAEFEKQGVKIISVFASSKEDIASYAGKQNAPFPILADPKLDLYKTYGIESSLSGMFKAMMNPIKMFKVMLSGFFNLNTVKDKPIIPADFLIDENFKIYEAHYGTDFGDHLPIDQVLKWKQTSKQKHNYYVRSQGVCVKCQ